MTEMRKALLAGLVVAALGSFFWFVLPSREPESVYQGKPLSFWMQGYDPGNRFVMQPMGPSSLPKWEAADEAIRAIGTNAIPSLLLTLQQQDSKFFIAIVGVLQRHHFDGIPFAPANRNVKAFHGFNALASGATNAVPRLIEIFDSDSSPFSQQAVPAILGNMGPAAESAVPALLRGVVHTNEVVRNNALFALGQIHAKPVLVVPALIKCLNDPDALVRAQAAHSLGEFASEAHSAVPALVELLRREALDPTGGSRSYMRTAVGSSWKSMIIVRSYNRGQSLLSVIKDALKSIDAAAAANAGVQ